MGCHCELNAGNETMKKTMKHELRLSSQHDVLPHCYIFYPCPCICNFPPQPSAALYYGHHMENSYLVRT